MLWQLLTLAAAFAWYAANTLGVRRSIGAVHLPRQLGNLEIAEAVPQRTLRWIAVAVAALLAAATAYTFSDLDHYVALYRQAANIGLTEPVLQRDAAFYLTRLPLLEVLHVLATVSVVLGGLLVFGLYALTGSVTFGGGRVRATPWAHAHLAVLLCALALVIAWGFQLASFQLVGGGGHDNGALTAQKRSSPPKAFMCRLFPPAESASRLIQPKLRPFGPSAVLVITRPWRSALTATWARPFAVVRMMALVCALRKVASSLKSTACGAFADLAQPAVRATIRHAVQIPYLMGPPYLPWLSPSRAANHFQIALLNSRLGGVPVRMAL